VEKILLEKWACPPARAASAKAGKDAKNAKRYDLKSEPVHHTLHPILNQSDIEVYQKAKTDIGESEIRQQLLKVYWTILFHSPLPRQSGCPPR
jgi:hypothetical protein